MGYFDAPPKSEFFRDLDNNGTERALKPKSPDLEFVQIWRSSNNYVVTITSNTHELGQMNVLKTTKS